MCGTLCLYVLYCLHNGKSFYDIVLEMRTEFGEAKDFLDKKMDIGGRPFGRSRRENYLTLQSASLLFVNEGGDSIEGNLDMKGNKIMNVNDHSDNSHVVNKGYFDQTLRLTLSGIDNTIDEK
jgi:hypothetical protein